MTFCPPLRSRTCVRLTLVFLVGGLPALAQPTLTGASPARNARSAPRATPVALTFSQAIAAASAGNLRVFSQQRGGQLNRPGGGVLSGGGTPTLTLDPVTDLRPGETVFVTVPATVQGTGGQAVAPYVYQFTAAAGGTGTGIFTTAVDVAVGTSTSGPSFYHVALGDIDGDGDLDILAADGDRNQVIARRNDGGGVFSALPGVGVADGSTDVVLADIDNDGDLDLLATTSNGNGTNGAVSVRTNNGTGTFGGAQNVGVNGSPLKVATGDIDGDGDLDLLAITTRGSGPDVVSVRRNDGAGGFSGTQTVAVGANAQSLALGDLDGDGDLDLVVANWDDNNVSVRLNDGAGLFGGTATVAVGNAPSGVALGDLDGDGDLDLLASNANDDNVSVRLNNGAGGFSGTTSIGVGVTPESVILGDLDHDGDLDFITNSFGAPFSGPNKVSVRFNNGTGGFSGTQEVSIVEGFIFGAALGDMDADGDLDIVTATQAFFSPLSIRYNGGTGPTGTRGAVAGSAFGVYPSLVAAGRGAVRVTGAGPHQPLALLSATGRLVAAGQADGAGAATMPVAVLAPGLYVVRAADGRAVRLVVE